MELFKLFGTIAVNNSGANSAIDETTERAEGAESKMSAAFKKIGAAVATYFATDKIIAFGKEIVNVAAEVDAETSAFEQIMGDYTDSAREKLNSVADATGVMSTRMQGHFTSLSAKFKGLGFDVTDATDLAQRGLTLAADAAAFWDKSLDDSSSALNSFINGSYEGGEAIGLFANDTQLAMYAVQQGVVGATKDWAALDEATKQATRLEFAENMYAQSGATGQAAREASQYANVQANLTEKWRQFKAEIGQPVLQNIVLPAMEKLSGLVDKASTGFEKLKKWVSDNKEELKQAANTISKLAEIAIYATGVFVAFKGAMAIQKAVQGFQAAQVALSMLSLEIGGANLAQAALNGTLTIGETIVGLLTGKIKLAAVAQGVMSKGQAALNAVMAANPIGIIITAIAALVAAFIYLWNNCEGFRNFWIGLWDGIKTVVKSVVDWIKENWQAMLLFLINPLAGIFKYCYDHFEGFRNFVDNIFNKIKNTATKVWNAIKTAITNPIETAKNIVKSQLDKIKSFFDKLKIKFPNIKLPHFSIKGKFSLAPPSVPKLAIDWYAKAMDNAMLLNSPTIFGMNGAGQLMGGGEAGQEVVAGSNTLMGMIRSAVRMETSEVNEGFERIISILDRYFPEIVANSKKKIVLNSGVVAGELAPEIDRNLGKIHRYVERGATI